jgi:HSP20 family molecular chaperone IbpA
MFFAPIARTRAVSPAFRSFDRSFERFVNDALAANTARGTQVAEDDKAWTLSLDVPGLAREDLTITLDGAVVRVESKADAKRQYKAAYELPTDVDAGASTAKLENGVLTLTLTKLVPVSTARTITIE